MSPAPAPSDLFAELMALSPSESVDVMRRMSPLERAELDVRWQWLAHHGQFRPEHDWRIWLIRAGRGFGKTRAGAEWVSQIARDEPGARIALVGATADDVRRVMIEGESGLLAVAREEERPVWTRAKGELRFKSGACAFAFSAEAPEALRGPQHGWAWCDEVAKWRNGDATWDNMMMGMRLRRCSIASTARAT